METRKKGSHLNIEERRQIAILDKEGWSPYKIGKKLKRASNTIRNELKRGTVKQVVGYKETEIYFPDTGDIVYKKHRKGNALLLQPEQRHWKQVSLNGKKW